MSSNVVGYDGNPNQYYETNRNIERYIFNHFNSNNMNMRINAYKNKLDAYAIDREIEKKTRDLNDLNSKIFTNNPTQQIVIKNQHKSELLKLYSLSTSTNGNGGVNNEDSLYLAFANGGCLSANINNNNILSNTELNIKMCDANDQSQQFKLIKNTSNTDINYGTYRAVLNKNSDEKYCLNFSNSGLRVVPNDDIFVSGSNNFSLILK